MINLATGNWPFFGFNPWAGVLESPDVSRKTPPAGGEFLSGTFDNDSRSLQYKLYIPSGDRNAPLPLVVMLHGCGQSAADFALGTGMNELAEEAQCLVLYPEQSSQANWNRCWNWYEEAHHERDEGEPALIAALTRKLIAEYAVDESRVSVAGLSSGGAMAVILGRTYPDLFKAVGCHSGLAHRSATDGFSAMTTMRDGADPASMKQAIPQSSIPVIVFHGDVDRTVHQKNSADVVQQTIACHMAQVPGETREMAMHEETGEARGRSFTRHTHRDEMGDVIAEHWTIHGTGHAWSGGNSHGSYTDASGPDASREMLRFFAGQ
ncbi:alpha/beta hydrolase family esterase [Massilia sp. CMS3.1]|uniref:extracellular catalytic domain type 1 short-chain-length polyhydroxyalkanoate depolymerase n=1 Tax=Massilia sp. CMS3.1 TaxID=3373083 RepID=UPI003EE56B49